MAPCLAQIQSYKLTIISQKNNESWSKLRNKETNNCTIQNLNNGNFYFTKRFWTFIHLTKISRTFDVNDLSWTSQRYLLTSKRMNVMRSQYGLAVIEESETNRKRKFKTFISFAGQANVSPYYEVVFHCESNPLKGLQVKINLSHRNHKTTDSHTFSINLILI